MRDFIGPAYLASPYSPLVKLTPEEKKDFLEMRYKQVLLATHFMLSKRLWVYSPIVHCHEIAKLNNLPTDAEFWKNYNHAIIEELPSVVVLCEEGWSQSKGVQDELEKALDWSRALYYLIPKKYVDESLPEPYVLIDHEPINVR